MAKQPVSPAHASPAQKGFREGYRGIMSGDKSAGREVTLVNQQNLAIAAAERQTALLQRQTELLAYIAERMAAIETLLRANLPANTTTPPNGAE